MEWWGKINCKGGLGWILTEGPDLTTHREGIQACQVNQGEAGLVCEEDSAAGLLRAGSGGKRGRPYNHQHSQVLPCSYAWCSRTPRPEVWSGDWKHGMPWAR